ncbi:hypothetical protein PVAND_017250 [Polypedilum vanderplanki]|uniref:F-box domain-containing protein n=1 Tax=Polypedilum vanderplanki TaxID=319348 RepID=A0A9J6BII9_POLVA|nr:hypothetical protein PVAND_017250 [Polypedilum vanderplanki]
MTVKENSINILDLPNEILFKIFKLADNDKNLLKTCRRFYDLVDAQNVSLFIHYRYLINPLINIDNFINSCSSLTLTFDQNFNIPQNYEDKFELFVQTYGVKIKKLILCSEIKNFATRFLKFLPNLEEIEFCGKFTIESSNIEKLSINLKKLKLNSIIDLRQLDIFNFQELEIDLVYFNSKEILNFLKYHKNIKKIKIYMNYFSYKFNLSQALKHLILENLDYFADDDQKVIESCLKNQKQLKELSLNKVSKKAFKNICENSRDLENFSFSFCYKKPEKILNKISKLKKLKTLSIGSALTSEQFYELSNLKLEFLENLTISIGFYDLREKIEKFAQNFKHLKSLSINFFSLIHLKDVARIFEIFNQIEELKLKFISNIEFNRIDEEFFYNSSHKNENLKTLIFDSKGFQIEKLITKFSSDFPNLEVINIVKNEEIFEKILLSFPKLRKIENLVMTEKLMKKLVKHSKDLEEYEIDEKLKNIPKKLSKNCSLSIKSDYYLETRICKEKETNVEISLLTYSHWKKIQIFIDSQKELKNLTILSSTDHEYCKNYLLALRNLGKTVRNLTLQGSFTISQLETFIKTVPNCEKIIFDNCHYFERFDDFLNLKDTKIQSICVNLKSSNLEVGIRNLNKLLRSVKFPNKFSKDFKFIVRSSEINEKMLKEIFEEFFENQQKFVKVKANFDEKNLKLFYEITAEEVE